MGARRLWCVALALGLGACGLARPSGPLSKTAEKLSEIRSGDMDMKLLAATESGAESGFHLAGPFSIPKTESLPLASVEYQRLGAEGTKPMHFLSTGSAAYIETGGKFYQLPPERVKDLKGASDPGSDGPFSKLDLDAWVRRPAVSDGPDTDGVKTQVIRGTVDVVAALNNVLEIAGNFGASPAPKIEGREAQRLRTATKAATFEAVTGKTDHLLRRMSMLVQLRASSKKGLSPKLAKLLGVNFSLDLSIKQPNKPIHVTKPQGALPLSKLPREGAPSSQGKSSGTTSSSGSRGNAGN